MKREKRSKGTANRLHYDDREEQILNIAARLFEDRGYERASLKHIADEAKIETASLYYYFRSKEELYVRVMGRSLEVLGEKVSEAIASASGPWDKLEMAAIAHTQCMLARDVVQVVFHPRFPLGMSDENTDQLRRQRKDYELMIKDIVDQLDLKPTIDKKIFLYNFLSAVNYSGLWYKVEGPMTPAEIARRSVAILRGCSASQV